MRTATKPANMNQDQKAPLLVVPSAGEAKRSRRRRKNKGEEGSGSGDAKKRKLSKEQMKFLEMNFCKEHKLEAKRKDQLATELGIHPRQVAVWFQNRRVRWKAQNLEAEYFSLKSASERDFAEKCRLENQVMKLKEQLCQAEKQIEKFCEILNGMFATTSPSSSFFIDTNEHAFDGEFMVEGFGDLSCVPDANFIHGMDWMNFPGL